MLCVIMSNWFTDYHHILQLRLLVIAVAFTGFWLGLWLLLAMGFRPKRRGRLVRHRRTNTLEGHMS